MTESDNGQHFATRARAEKKSLTFFREAGRGKALVHINNLVKFNPGLILLMGEEGSGRSRVLKQFAGSLKGKPGKICILDRAIKNDSQLYEALVEGFEIDHIPGDDAKSLQKSAQAYLEANVTTNKPIIIALDDVQRCSLAMLEALIELQSKFRQMSLILVGDAGLEKMLQRLRGGKLTANAVLLSPLDAREMRQYINWRLPFQISDIELTNIINMSRGNLGLLEQEALKKEQSHQQENTRKAEGGMKISHQAIVRLSLVVLMAGVVGTIYFLYSEPFSSSHIGGVANEVKTLLHLEDDKTSAPQVNQEPEIPLRSNEAWVERQMILLNQDTGNS